MLDRVLEPEVMDDRQEAVEYDAMDHGAVNQRFVMDFLLAGPIGLECLDLGTGTALIPVELCRQEGEVRIMASDASRSMLEIARYRLEVKNLMSRVQLHHGDAKKLNFQSSYFDSVMSNSLIHHLPTHAECFAEAIRVLRPGGLLFVRDLCRPNSVEQLESLVALHAAGDSENGKQMLRQSLYAALTRDEAQSLAVSAGLPLNCVAMTSDRHWTLCARKA